MARPRTPINWVDVEKLCGLQCTQEEIAWFCGISVDTLTRASLREQKMSFAEYYEQKKGMGRISLRRAQWQLAQKGNATMLIWLGKQHLGQKDRSFQEHSGPDGKPIETKDSAAISDEELNARIAAILAKKESAE